MLQGRRKLFYGGGMGGGDFFQNLTFGILFLETLFWAYKFFMCPHIPLDTIRVICNFKFSNKVSEPTKTSKKDHSFYNTISRKKPHSFYESQIT